MISPARTVAFDVLRRVHDRAFASDLLLAKSKDLDTRDAGLASELVFGCLRHQLQLDHLIGRTRLDVEVRIALRLAIYQLRYLTRVPPHAAVAESVELVKRARKRSAAALVNAVLRKVDRTQVDWPGRATELSCPPWLLERWDRQFGPELAATIARTFLNPPETFVAETGRIQDIGSQSIVPLLDLAPGQTFLDLCAAPGNKTAQALQHGVRAVACDLHLHRLRNVPAANCHRVVLDATQPLPFATTFDRILFLRVYNVSGPCCKTLSIEDARGSLKAVLQVVSDSSIHCDELVSLPKSSLTHHLGLLGPKKTDEVNRALRIALELEKDALLYK